MITIRRALDHDCDQFPGIEQDASIAFHSVPHLGWIGEADVRSAAAWRAIVAQGLSLIAEKDGTPLAFLAVSAGEEGWHIEELSVRHAQQGQGIGSMLLAASLEHARAKDAPCVTLTTFRHLKWNAPFYARFGFEPTSFASTGRLRKAREEERLAGLDLNKRCAMMLRLDNSYSAPGA